MSFLLLVLYSFALVCWLTFAILSLAGLASIFDGNYRDGISMLIVGFVFNLFACFAFWVAQ